MKSLADKIRAKGEIASAVAELAEEEVKPKAKTLKIKVGAIKKTNKKK